MVEFWNDSKLILITMIVILIVDTLWDMYLTIRQINTYYRTKELPVELRQYWSDELYKSMRIYKIHLTTVNLFSMFILNLLIGCLELYFGLYAIFWDVSKKMCFFSDRELWVSMFFMDLYVVYSYAKSIPFVLYNWKFVKLPSPLPSDEQSLWISFVTQIIVYILILVLVALLTLSFVFVFLGLDDLYYVSIIFVQMMFFIYSLLAVPFSLRKTERLEDGPLRRDIEKLTTTVGFPIDKVRIVITKTPHQSGNAFFYGCLCYKRIIIYDSLLINKGLTDISSLATEEKGKGLSTDLVIAVVAHELGHWKYGHFYKTLILSQIFLIFLTGLYCTCIRHEPIYEAVGFEKGLTPVMPGLLLISILILPYTTFGYFVFLLITRRFETQADRFAYNLGYSKELCSALLKLNADNKSFPISDNWYSAWHDTHPNMLRRCAYLRRLQERNTINNNAKK